MPKALLSRSLVAVLAALAACECDDGNQTNAAGGRLVFEREFVDFGNVIVGQQKEVQFNLRNSGRGPLKITSIDRGPAFPAEVRYSPQRGLELQPGDEVALTLFFEPTEPGERKGVLVFQNDSAEAVVELEVVGIGVKTDLRFDPSEVGFGPVLVEDIASRTVSLRNHGDSDVDVLVDNLSGDNPEMFRLSLPGGDPRSVRLAKGDKVDVDFAFQPAAVGTFSAQLRVRACVGCEGVLVRLSGRGIAAGLVAEPEPLDFGPVLPGTRSTKELTFRNVGNRAIAILNVRPEAVGTDFTVPPPGGWPKLEPGVAAAVNVVYAPSGLGPDVSRLVVETDDARAPRFEVQVKGYGGGPEIQLVPSAVDFGTVALGFPITRRIAITNKGLNDPSSTNDDLKIDRIELPEGLEFAFALTGTDTLPLQIAPGQRKFIEVTYDPQDEGADETQLKLFSNDGDTREAMVPMRGLGRLLPPCDLDINPLPNPGLNFGVVARGRRSQLSVNLRNVGINACVLGKVDLSDDSSPAFTLVNGPVYGRELAVGATLGIDVEFAPPGNAPTNTLYAGGLDVVVNARAAADRQRKVLLSGRGSEVCLSITPAGIDFGVVRAPACQTNERMYTIYNACRGAVQIKGIRVGQGSGTFSVGSPPSLPRTLQPQSELRFSARYRTPDRPTDPAAPLDLGPHQGTIEVETDQVTPSLVYVLPMNGRGDVNANMVESFSQADRARADILFVVDDSGSMDEEQTTLAREFDNFMKFAVEQQIDYHIGVVTTSIGSGYPAGRLLPEGSANRIVSPLMPDPMGIFRANVRVGTDGNPDETGLEAAYLALSDPNINGPNAGFLRPDAYLSIIIVSDEEDSSNRTLDFYANFFQNIKGPRGANLVSVSGIVGTEDPECSGPGGSADYGARYIEIARRTSGITESICNASWSVALQKLGLVAFGYKSRFILSSEPDLGSLHVFIDENPNDTEPPIEIPQGPLWTFTPDANAVDFSPLAVPPAGAKIDVQYTVACH